jgi:hypothetical protein
MKLYKLVVFILLLFPKLSSYGQINKDSVFIKFSIDTVLQTDVKNSIIQIIQANRLVKINGDQKISVKIGTEFSVEFVMNNVILSSINRIKIFSDTIIKLSIKSLEEIVLKSKKKIVSENTQGYDYLPQNDSLLKEKSILMGLQRLPFITGYDNQTVPKYRQDGKILFTINGKQRRGIENNWALLLSIIKGKDVYKVELIEDIPIQIKNQGYAAIINILTVEANMYGNSFSVATIYDQRNNINPSISATFLRKRFDVSLNIGRDEDNQNGSRKTEVIATNAIQSILETKSKFKSQTLYTNIDIGFRKDSLRDFALNISGRYAAYNRKYTPTYQFGINSVGITDKLDKDFLRANFSYLFRKQKGLTHSFAAVVQYAQETKGNNLAFYIPKQTDSAAARTTTDELYWIMDYNLQDLRNQKYPKELGVKVYNRNLEQDFKRYDIDFNNNEPGQLLYSKVDSFTTEQYSIRPYFRVANNISKTKRLSVSFFPELYVINNSSINTRTFFTPSLTIGYRQILNSKNSLRYNFAIEFLKPNIDYLSNVQLFSDPQQKQVGSASLKPSKQLNAGIEWVYREKGTFSYGVNFTYGFDQYDFFKVANPATGTLLSFANNGLQSYRFSNVVSYQNQFFKNLWLDVSGSVDLNLHKNVLFNTAFNRVTFHTESNIRLGLGERKGTIAARVFYSSNPTNGQGYSQGTRMYGLWYANQIFKKKIAITLIADQFLLKNRNRLNYAKTNEFEIFTTTTEPYRFLKLRLAYRFSDIKLSKEAAKKATDISGEAPRLL